MSRGVRVGWRPGSVEKKQNHSNLQGIHRTNFLRPKRVLSFIKAQFLKNLFKLIGNIPGGFAAL